jgi:hypothetical protein
MHEERDEDTRGISGDKVRIFALAPPWTHPPLVSWFRLDPSLGVHGRAPAENWLGRVGGATQGRAAQVIVRPAAQ